jgi:hypothetical protein
MNIAAGLENDSYKYKLGVYDKFTVPFDENKTISLVCGRNDRAAVQLLLHSEQEMLVSVNGDACFYERGPIEQVRVDAVIPGLSNAQIQVKLIGLVEDDDRQLKADMILDQTFIHVDKRRVQPVWIEVELGKDVKPGVYVSEISVYGHSMFEDETLLRTLTFELQVVDAVLSDPEDYSFYLDLWQHNSNIARKYDLELWSDKHFAVMENYVASLAALGQKAITVVVSEIPWSGQASFYDRIEPANMYEYSIVKVIRTENGDWKYDFEALNAYVDLCMKYGINREIEVFGLLNIWVFEDAGFGRVIPDYSDAIRIRYFDENTRTYQYIKEKKELERYVAALENNFKQRGWIDKVRILADEPVDMEKFTSRLSALREMAPSFRYKVALDHAEFIGLNMEGLVDFVLNLNCMSGEQEQILALRQNIQGTLSFYVGCTHKYPNTLITSPLLESRLMPWLAWYWNIDGFLRWSYTVWPNDPLNKISYHYPFFPAGDTNFVYPGRDGKPMLTLRYKLLQKGIRDYEIMSSYVRRGGDREKLLQRMNKVFLWQESKEMHPSARRKQEELFSQSNQDYEEIIAYLLQEMVDEG